MDDADGGLSFDFEGGLDAVSHLPTFSGHAIQSDPSNPVAVGAAGAPPTSQPPPSNMTSGPGPGPGRRSFRQTVCRHWLRSLCMKGDACGFLHQYDKSRMPVCRFFRLYGECREQDCVYKHTNEDIKECNMYKLGFCPNGPDCRYRHLKLPGPPPPVEEVLQRIQQFNNTNSNRFFQHRNSGHPQQPNNFQFSQGPNNSNQGSLTRLGVDSSNVQQQQASLPLQQAVQAQISNGAPNQARTVVPLTQGASRYFIVKSCNRENLELSAQQGVWATQRSNEAKLNEAFDSVENVILVFSVNRTRHFQGCAKMTSKIGGLVGGGNWKYAHGTAHYGRNFSVKWLKLCELSFHKTRHLRNPYNENLPVKISRDCQELEPSIGEQLTSLLYQEPDSELMAISVAAESKREEEKLKGVNPDNASESPDIVPFEDNEEEEDEEEEESEEDEDENFNAGAQGRGGGRGAIWAPQMAMARGARPFMGMRAFPPMMLGADGFSYGAMPPEGFGMGDPFGAGPRAFPPYGPRFPGDFSGPAPGMLFQRRPPGNTFPAGGYGLMLGPGRAPFMGQGRGGQNMIGGAPVFAPPPPPTQNNNWMNKREQQGAGGERFSSGADPHRELDMENSGGGHEEQGRLGMSGPNDEQFISGSGLKPDESESEDEAPRRSRHDEGKKKRRGSEEEGTTLE